MPLTADQHTTIATGYDKAAADLSIPAVRRDEFARKADWFRHLARLEAKRESTTQMPDPSMENGPWQARAGAKIFGMKPLLTSLWLAGAVLYLISTLLFTNAVNFFGGDDERKPIGKQVSRLSLPYPSGSQVKSPKSAIPAYPQPQAATVAADRPHAISPDQPSSESPLVNDPTAVPQQTAPLPSAAEQATPQIASSADGADVLTLKSAASIRSDPSRSAQVIGTAAAGAQLRVTAYDSGWAGFLDPSSGKTGWVHSTFVEPSAGAEAAVTATKQVDDLPDVAPPKSKSIKSVKQKAKGVVVPKRQRPSGRSSKAYVELPSDEEFLPPRKRGLVGILEKRRMLREGLMSPGFRPPQ